MYLSKYRLKLSWNNRNTLNNVLNGHQLHRSVQSLFGKNRKDAKVLYVRNFKTVTDACVYIYSEDQPSSESEHFEQIFCRQQTIDFPTNAVKRFQIVCNPVKQSDGHRHFLLTMEEREKWFLRQAKQNGFECLSLIEEGKENITVKKDAKSAFTFPSVTFKGILQVTDPGKFASALRTGIGAEKAYGMGMLMVA